MKCKTEGCKELATHGDVCWTCMDEALRRAKSDKHSRKEAAMDTVRNSVARQGAKNGKDFMRRRNRMGDKP